MSIILSGSDGLSDVDGSASTPAIRGTDANTGIFFPAADTIAFAEGGSEAARFDSAGRLLVGLTSANTSGSNFQVSQGITFPATQSASSDANTLDDYEEGTWTISDQSGASLAITNTTGRYVKIGRVVYITCFPGYPSTASGSTARLSLPFTVSTEFASLSKSYISGANSQTNWLPLAENGQAYFGFRAPDGGDSNATNANLSNKSVIVSGWYLT